jgi:DNA polymerase-1
LKIIVDCNNVAHIVNHGMGHLSNDERRTGVVFGFMKQILTLSKRMKTNQFIFCWDSQKSFRKNIYPEYKGNRKNKIKTDQEEFERQTLYDQISEIRRDILPELGFKNNFIKTGYEADDLIAYTVLTNPKKDFTIVSTDQDLYQLLNDTTRMFNTITKKFTTKTDFMEKFQLEPLMFREIKAISGCTSDYIKGIDGVGEATAAKYIRNDRINSNLINRIHEGQDIIERNRKLTYLPFQNKEYGTLPNMEITLKKDSLSLYNFKKLFNKLSFNSFLNDMSEWERSFGL